MDSIIAFECKFVRPEKHAKKRVLILRKDVLGDFIVFSPAMPYYREFYKDYELSMVLNTMARGLAPLFHYVDNIISYDGKKFRTSFLYRRAFMKNLAKKDFDVVVHPVYSRETIGDLMVRVTRAKETIAFKATYDHNDKQYTKIIKVPENIDEVSRNMAFVSAVVGKKCEAHFPTIDINLLDKSFTESLKKEYGLVDKKYCIIFPGAGASYRIWPLEKFATIADYISSKGITPVICGGSISEAELGEKIIEASKNRSAIVNLIGKTGFPSLSVITHLVNDSLFYFGSETGILHLAAAVNVPTISILGGGHFGRFFPYGDLSINRIVFDPNMPITCKNDDWKCAMCLKPGEIAPCIKNISVEDAMTEIEALLKILNY